MSEVEKLYSLAWIEPRCNIYPTFYDCVKHPHEKCEDCVEWEYPPFTAEKQIELIKWLLKSFDMDFSLIEQRIDTTLDGINWTGSCIGGSGSAHTFEDSLCMAIIDLWQDLTEVEQNEIREILE